MTRGAGLNTILFVPGSRPDRFAKALASGADLVCVDLEDAVAPGDKDTARTATIDALRAESDRLAVRINGLRTSDGLRDLLGLRDAGVSLAFLFVPMVESAAEIGIVRSIVSERRIVPLIETVAGLRAAHEIAAAPGVAALMFGGGDLAAQLGTELAWEPLAAARGQFALACAGAGVGAIDVPFIRLDDAAGLEEETVRAKALGFTAKAAIHPAQIETIARIFRPSDADLAEAQRALAAFSAAGERAISHEGRMLEAPVIERYRNMLAGRESGHA